MGSRGLEVEVRRRHGWLVAGLLAALLVAGGLTWRYDLLDRLGGDAAPSSAPGDPASVAPPAGLHLPSVVAPAAVARPLTGPSTQRADPTAVRAALGRLLGSRDLGRHVRALVAPLAGGAPVLSVGTGTATPASTTKLVTTTSALLELGPQHTFTTRVTATDGGRRVVLVGGGDPYLMRRPHDPLVSPEVPGPADVTTLARTTARALAERGVKRVSVGYDASLFSGPAVSPDWEDDYVSSGVISPISALWVDEGRSPTGYGRVADPAAEAARVFAAALTQAGVTVTGDPEPARGRGAVLASATSAPLSQIVERILQVSDNEGAEVMLRQVGLAGPEHQGSFLAGHRTVVDLLGEHGIALGNTVLHDGSGLARDDEMDPAVLVGVLRLDSSPAHPELRSVVTGLPVAGFSGSLADRMDHGPPAGLGRVRAKTGTLTGVSSLAGIATDLDGDATVFVLMADQVSPPRDSVAQQTLDDAAAALGACHCAR